MHRKRVIILALIFLVLAFVFIYFYKFSLQTRIKGIKEDVNRDGQIDIVDIATVGRAFGSRPGDLNWNAIADLNKDDSVDNLDMYMVEEMFKKVKG
ncbi:MAG: dockerin type I domain-containing protein [Candidatus Aenigmarchaeota archaeon]|nr:dockerin type I domain-containing protein [Candidatus Aenigmarchaeota archaeon]